MRRRLKGHTLLIQDFWAVPLELKVLKRECWGVQEAVLRRVLRGNSALVRRQRQMTVHGNLDAVFCPYSLKQY